MSRPNVRDQLLATALDTLHRRGYNGAGVQDITDGAGVPKGSFYNHFESKEALALEVIDLYARQQGAIAGMLSDESIPPVERLRRYFELLIRTHAEREYERGCLLGNFSTELADQSRPIRDRLAATFAGWSRVVENCIREGQETGDIAGDIDARTLAAFVLNSFEGAILRMKAEKDGRPLDDFLKLVFTRVLAPGTDRVTQRSPL